MKLGEHPWRNESGQIDAKTAGIWMANMIMQAGGTAQTAFACAALVADDIEQNPEKFGVHPKFGTNPALDKDPLNPNRPAPLVIGGPYNCGICGKRHQVGFCTKPTP